MVVDDRPVVSYIPANTTTVLVVNPHIDADPDLTENARIVLTQRYLRRDADNNVIETPAQLFRRVANHIASCENKWGESTAAISDQFYDLLASLRFLPNSPTLRNAGVNGTLSGCFVIPIPDSMDGICEARRQAAFVGKYGGGVGYDFSELRPRGSLIATTHRGACGPVAVMKDFDMLSETFTQGAGSFREMAQMMILRCDHPDIFEFITCKDNGSSIRHANISVAVTDEFIAAMEGRGSEDYGFELRFDGVSYGTVDARTILDAIAKSAWTTGDPGLVFIDRANGMANPLSHIYNISSSNPCGEQFLGPYESCNLGSLNLVKYVENGEINYERLGNDTQLAVRFLDDVVEVNDMPTPETDIANKNSRRIGLGVMGWADTLVECKIPYDSEEAIELGLAVIKQIRTSADTESIRLGVKRGTYDAYKGSTHEAQGTPYRNAFRLCLAPTGSISIIAGASSGIEPYFALEWDREIEGGIHLVERIPSYAAWLATRTPYDTVSIQSALPSYFRTASQISPDWHVRMQAAFQTQVDNAISKTINMPKKSTVEDVKYAYQLAIDSGCKGITIYRDGSRDKQVLNATDSGTEHESTVVGSVHSAKAIRNRLPDERPARVHKFSVGDQEAYLTAGLYEDGSLGELFVHASKQGSTVRGLMDAIAQLTSIALQYGVPLSAITSKLRGSRFEPAGMTSNQTIPTATSLTDYIFAWLDLKFGEAVPVDSPKTSSGVACPDCGSVMHFMEGCLSCVCGYSRCG